MLFFLSQRVRRQAQTGTQLAQWLHTVIQRTADHNKDDSFEGVPAGVLSSVTHASLQEKERGGGFNAFDAGQLVDGPACFSIAFTDAFYATWFPHELEYFDVSSLHERGDPARLTQPMLPDRSLQPVSAASRAW